MKTLPTVRLSAMAVAALLATGCAQNLGNVVPGFSLPTTAPAPAPSPAPVPAPSATQAAQTPKPLATREAGGLRNLLAKGTVTGEDLLPELKAVRRLMNGSTPGDAYQQLLGTSTAPAASNPGLLDWLTLDPSALLNLSTKAAMSQLERSLRASLVDLVIGDLRRHLDVLVGEPGALKAETINLPSPEGLTPQQMQRAVTLAALVVASRVSSKMLTKASQDLAGLEGEYQELIAKREQAARLLQTALTTSMPSTVRTQFTSGDLQELRQLQQRSVGEFAQDMGAQNLALRYMALTQPAQFAQYRVQSQGLNRRQAAALRSITGVVAYGAMLGQFGREMVRLGQAQSIQEVVALGPLAAQFAMDVPMVVEAAFRVASHGIVLATRAKPAFRVRHATGTEEVSDAAAVFALLDKHGVGTHWRDALFRDQGKGLVQAVYGCDARATGQMLDAAVSRDRRMAFARELRLPEPDSFSFAATLEGSPQLRAPIEELLADDHRPRSGQRRQVMGAAQWDITGQTDNVADARPGYLRWNNDQLFRLVFSSKDGVAAQLAALEFNGVRVAPIPSMQSLYAYEVLTEACRSRFSPVALRQRT